ncbi:hypothetical protein ACO0K9_10035 [Undibacterium sp. Ji50W]|uniref:hypothetical protein n=1 Tax=Undibacterium sp. Ji50W TaxID=3413041 RepID=UPI003BF400F0
MQNFSTDALLLAVPELKDVAPKHYQELIYQAEQATSKTRKPFWRELMIGLTLFMTVYLSTQLLGSSSIWVSGVVTFASTLTSIFVIDLLYFRKLKPAIIARLAKIKT